MEIWHATSDAPRTPERVSAGEWVSLTIGTWPIAAGQRVWVEVAIERADGTTASQHVAASWRENARGNSYWRAELAPFATGDHVRYRVRGRSAAGVVSGPAGEFRVGPKLYLALLWHQHQPLYRDASRPTARGSYLLPAVRHHAIRDYYAMAALVAEHPGVHLTINLTPVLLAQIEDYIKRGATDRALELTRTPAEQLSTSERAELLRTFFDANPETQIRPHRRYAELWDRARSGSPLDAQELRDLQMWANVAWFGQEFRDGPVALVTGETASVHRFVVQERDFTAADVEAMIEEQYKILRAVLPVHRRLQELGQIELSTSPYYHPILPLLLDTDRATLDRPGTTRPPRFSVPEDADAQVRLGVESHGERLGRPPRGMWPAEGAVAQQLIPLFARHGAQWIASDRGVLARSGRWGYRADDPDVLCQPYRAEEGGAAVSVFFRDGSLADQVGFRYEHHADYAEAARQFVEQIKVHYARRVRGPGDRVLTVALDGENAWGAYRQDARPFLRELYRLLEADSELATVTFSEYLDGNVARGIPPHPTAEQERVHELFTGSWADEDRSAAGVDLGTWIGEAEENAAWLLLGEVRAHLAASGATLESAPAAYHAMFAAEGSDWFWWLGSDQESSRDAELDALFHAHLQQVYHALGEAAPAHVTPHGGPPTVVWTPTAPVTSLAPGERLLVCTPRPGRLVYAVNQSAPHFAQLTLVRGREAAAPHFQRLLGPFAPGDREVRFRFAPFAEAAAARLEAHESRLHTIAIVEPGAAPAITAPAVVTSAASASPAAAGEATLAETGGRRRAGRRRRRGGIGPQTRSLPRQQP